LTNIHCFTFKTEIIKPVGFGMILNLLFHLQTVIFDKQILGQSSGVGNWLKLFVQHVERISCKSPYLITRQVGHLWTQFSSSIAEVQFLFAYLPGPWIMRHTSGHTSMINKSMTYIKDCNYDRDSYIHCVFQSNPHLVKLKKSIEFRNHSLITFCARWNSNSIIIHVISFHFLFIYFIFFCIDLRWEDKDPNEFVR